MIEVTWAQIRNNDLNGALNSLARQRVPYATTLKLLTLLKSIEVEQKKAVDMAKILSEKYGSVDPETKQWKLKDGVTQEEFAKAEQEYAETKCKLCVTKINSADLMGTELSAIELARIEMFIDIPSEEKGSRLSSVPVEGNA